MAFVGTSHSFVQILLVSTDSDALTLVHLVCCLVTKHSALPRYRDRVLRAAMHGLVKARYNGLVLLFGEKGAEHVFF